MKAIARPIRCAQSWFRPGPDSRFVKEAVLDENLSANKLYAGDLNRYSLYVGVFAFVLPLILISGSASLGDRVCWYDSISHYYYSRYLGGVFVILLSLIGALMFAFNGETRRESVLATVGGAFLILTAFFPTSEDGCDAYPVEARSFSVVEKAVVVKAGDTAPAGALIREGCSAKDLEKDMRTCVFVDPFEALVENGKTVMLGVDRHFTFVESLPWLEYVHFVSAAIVFILLFVFCVFIFARIDPWHLTSGVILDDGMIDGVVGNKKALRNGIYYVCGFLIFVSLAALGWNAAFNESDWWDMYNLTFFFEALGLFAFGVAWSVRGRIFRKLFDDVEDVRRRKEWAETQKAKTAA